MKDDREERGFEQKAEQFPVLAGLRQYAIGEKREHVLLDRLEKSVVMPWGG
jgi:hypothetical protein